MLRHTVDSRLLEAESQRLRGNLCKLSNLREPPNPVSGPRTNMGGDLLGIREEDLRNERNGLRAALEGLVSLQERQDSRTPSNLLPVDFFEQSDDEQQCRPLPFTESGVSVDLFQSVFGVGGPNLETPAAEPQPNSPQNRVIREEPAYPERNQAESGRPRQRLPVSTNSNEEMEFLLETDIAKSTPSGKSEAGEDQSFRTIQDVFDWYKWE